MPNLSLQQLAIAAPLVIAGCLLNTSLPTLDTDPVEDTELLPDTDLVTDTDLVIDTDSVVDSDIDPRDPLCGDPEEGPGCEVFDLSVPDEWDDDLSQDTAYSYASEVLNVPEEAIAVHVRATSSQLNVLYYEIVRLPAGVELASGWCSRPCSPLAACTYEFTASLQSASRISLAVFDPGPPHRLPPGPYDLRVGVQWLSEAPESYAECL
jgi:hypothetical protein